MNKRSAPPLFPLLLLLLLLLFSSAAWAGEGAGKVVFSFELPTGGSRASGTPDAVFSAVVRSEALNLASSAGLSNVRHFPFISARVGVGVAVAETVSGTADAASAALRNVPGVLRAHGSGKVEAAAMFPWPEDEKWPNDYIYGTDIIGHHMDQRFTGVVRAWEKATGSKDVIVAVVDTGIYYTHEDLAANMARDSLGNFGYNAFTGSGDPLDDHDHGTHVAGIIGAMGNNRLGLAGVNWNVGLLGVKVLDRFANGDMVSIMDGIEYVLREKAAGTNIRVANFSLIGWYSEEELGGPGSESPYGLAYKALSDAGIFVVAAAGNNSINLEVGPYPWGEEFPLGYPSMLKFDNQVTVGATHSSSSAERPYGPYDKSTWAIASAPYTNYGTEYVHLAAQGWQYSTVREGTGWSIYRDMKGTSMAAPFVAGTAALLLSRFPLEDAGWLKERILATAKRYPEFAHMFAEGRVLDIESALVGAAPAPVRSVAVESMSIPADLNIVVGGGQQVVPAVLPADATDKSVEWVSEDESIVSVSPGGVLTGRRAGESTYVTARLKNGVLIESRCLVTVSAAPVPAESVSVSPSELRLANGATRTLAATVLPAEATNKVVTWRSSNPDVASVSGAGVVTAKEEGVATITARTNDGGFEAACEVTVVRAEPTPTPVPTPTPTPGPTPTPEPTPTPGPAPEPTGTSGGGCSTGVFGGGGIVALLLVPLLVLKNIGKKH